jgi:uncharacterized protein (TIGR03067 family)
MNRKTLLLACSVPLALLAVLFLNPFAQRRAGAAKGLEPFQGRWAVMRQQDGGPIVPTGDYFEIEGGFVTIAVVAGVPGRFYVIDALDPTRDQPWIDWTAFDARDGMKIASQRGVYRLNGDTLILCMSRPGEDRPKEAGTEPGEGYSVIILRRIK